MYVIPVEEERALSFMMIFIPIIVICYLLFTPWIHVFVFDMLQAYKIGTERFFIYLIILIMLVQTYKIQSNIKHNKLQKFCIINAVIMTYPSMVATIYMVLILINSRTLEMHLKLDYLHAVLMLPLYIMPVFNWIIILLGKMRRRDE